MLCIISTIFDDICQSPSYVYMPWFRPVEKQIDIVVAQCEHYCRLQDMWAPMLTSIMLCLLSRQTTAKHKMLLRCTQRLPWLTGGYCLNYLYLMDTIDPLTRTTCLTPPGHIDS